MSKLKKGTGKNVLVSARERISYAFDHFEKVYVSFSGGKDSSVLFHLAAEEARKRGRTLGVLFIDLEAQYELTIKHVEEMVEDYKDCTELFWVALPMLLRNAVSQFQPRWCCWEEGVEWVREKPKKAVPADMFPFFVPQMEFEEFMVLFGLWYGGGKEAAALVGIRCDESLNRFRTIASKSKETHGGHRFTTKVEDGLYNVYPLYDWRTKDLWTYHAKHPDKKHNEVYDRMHMAGVPLSKMRLCQPYGDDQRRGLWLFHLLEPHTWFKLVARVNGANSGALYVEETGNITGYNKITLPPGHTWKSFCNLLLKSLPKKTREHFLSRFKSFISGWKGRGYTTIPDEAPRVLETKHWAPSWRRLCKVILRNDHWCKGLGLTQPKSAAYDRYLKIKKDRKEESPVIKHMNITTPRDVLLSRLALVNPITGGRSTLPALACIRMSAQQGTLTIQATNTDTQIEVEIPVADMAGEGEVVFSGKRLESLLKASSSDAVNLEAKGDDIKINVGGIATVRGLPAAEWPHFKKPEGNQSITLPQTALASMLDKTAFATSTDGANKMLEGILFSGKGTLRLVASDRRRFSIIDCDCQIDGLSSIVPNELITPIRAMLGGSGDVTLSFSENAVSVKVPGVEVSGKLLESSYPNYEPVMAPRENWFPIPRKSLISVLGRVKLFASEKKSYPVVFKLSDGRITLFAQSEEMGEMSESMEIASQEKTEVMANGEYFIAALKAVDSESVEVSFGTSKEPIKIRSGSWLHVIAPLFLS